MVAGKVRSAMGFHRSSGNNRMQQQEMSTPSPSKPPSFPSSTVTGLGRKPANLSPNQKPVFSRSFGVYFPRSSAQVHATRSPQEQGVAELLRQVDELREREALLRTELLNVKLLRESVSIIPVLESKILEKNTQVEISKKTIERLEFENERLKREVEELKVRSEEQRKEREKKEKELEAEIAELRETMSSRESEECVLSPSQRFQGLVEASAKSNLIRSLKRVGSSRSGSDPSRNPESHHQKSNGDGGIWSCSRDSRREETESQRPSHSRFNSEDFAESTLSTVRSRAPRVPKPPPRPAFSSLAPPTSSNVSNSTENRAAAATEKPILAPPPPPPPPPPAVVLKPAPQPPKSMRPAPAKVRRVPEVAEFYHSLMRRESSNSRRESSIGSGGAVEALPATANTRDMIGEIENRSAYLLSIKTDVETQGDFIRLLIKEVETAAFADIEDVVPFVKWLDDELSYLVDERAVLKHFNWPEQKADALREAAFGYCDVKKLESEASSFCDDPHQPSGSALKKMQALLEKLEHGVYNLSRVRESAAKRYKGFQIPMDWMLEAGIISQIKLASVKLAMKYMKRVSAELAIVGGGPDEEDLILQGVRFAFRVHQFAGGFDVETMRGFQELRDKARSCHVQCQNQTQ